MTWAPGITLRPWTVGGTTTTEAGEALFTRAKITASRSLMLWGATGWRYESSPRTITSTEGAQVSGDLPVCDQPGWRTEGGAIIDVSVPNSYTHVYTIKVSQFRKDASGREISVGEERTYANVFIPTGDLSPFDLDLTLPVGTAAGGVMLMPDSWSGAVAAAEAAAAAAAADAAQGAPASEGRTGYSPYWKHAYVSPSPLDRVAIMKDTLPTESGFVQEPQVFLIGGTIHMIYSGGPSLHHAWCPATSDPTDPLSWTKSGRVLGQGVGGVAGMADHSGVYVEDGTVYVYFRDAAGGLSLATASTASPTALTYVGSVLSPPVGVSAPLANAFLLKRGPGDYLFYFEGLTTTPLWSIGVATGATPAGPFTGAAMSLTGLGDINPGKSTFSNPFVVAEDGGYTMWFHSAWGEFQRGSGGPTAGYMATSLDGLAWTVAYERQQIVRLTHPAEVDQVADFSLLDVGEEKYAFWSANTEYTTNLRVGRIMATRVRRPRARMVGGKIIPLDGIKPAGPMLPTPWLGHKKLSPAVTFTDSQTDVVIPGLTFTDITLPDTVRADWTACVSIASSLAAYMTVTVEVVSSQPIAGGENPVYTSIDVLAGKPTPITLAGSFVMQAGITFTLRVKVKNSRGDNPTSTVYAGSSVIHVDTRKVP